MSKGNLTTHVLDTYNGKPGSNIKGQLFRIKEDKKIRIKDFILNSNGRTNKPILEKNDFSDNYYLETLIQWKPNPYTIFYAGGTQYYKEPNPFSNNLRLETSQVYLKFQYFYQPNS